MQQARALDANELGDVIEGCPFEAMVGEAPQRRIEDRLARGNSRFANTVRGECGI